MNLDITVIILTLNEEKHIERCIRSIQTITKNVILIDSHSIDRTVEIARSLGAIVITNEWPGNHAKQFQWALEHAPISTTWIMKMDADEYILPELANEIINKLPSLSQEVSGVYLKRRVYFLGRWIKRGGYYPTWLLRIWRYNKGIMEQRWMDEHIKLLEGSVVYFDNDFVDENLNNLTWWTQKHNHYATREAIDILNTLFDFQNSEELEPRLLGTQEQRKRWLKKYYAMLPLFFRPLLYFFWRYFIKLGLLDGKPGLVWHCLQGGWYRFLVDAKIYEIYCKAGRDKKKILEFIENEYGIKFYE